MKIGFVLTEIMDDGSSPPTPIYFAENWEPAKKQAMLYLNDTLRLATVVGDGRSKAQQRLLRALSDARPTPGVWVEFPLPEAGRTLLISAVVWVQ